MPSPRLPSLLLAGLFALAGSVPAHAAPANVTVRVEGAATTLLSRTAVRTTTTAVSKDGNPAHSCSGTAAAGALELATGGDWGGSWFDAFGFSVERVRGETHVFPEPDYFTLWINNRSASEGVCGATTELQEGDDVLIFVDRCVADPVTYLCTNQPVLPLGLSAPRTVTRGAPFSVSVVEYAADGTPAPVAGASVTGGDAPATTNAAGVASVTIGAAGAATLRATKEGRARSASEALCATNGADGACGSPAPAAASCATNGHDGRCGTLDRTAPEAWIDGIAEGARFALGTGPRELRARIDADPAGLLVVKLRLTRNDRGRCTYFSGRSERFRRMPCGASHGGWFAVGDRERVDYLLPRALPRGRYVLDVNVIDKAYNRDDARRRGGNRIVFHVG